MVFALNVLTETFQCNRNVVQFVYIANSGNTLLPRHTCTGGERREGGRLVCVCVCVCVCILNSSHL